MAQIITSFLTAVITFKSKTRKNSRTKESSFLTYVPSDIAVIVESRNTRNFLYTFKVMLTKRRKELISPKGYLMN